MAEADAGEGPTLRDEAAHERLGIADPGVVVGHRSPGGRGHPQVDRVELGPTARALAGDEVERNDLGAERCEQRAEQLGIVAAQIERVAVHVPAHLQADTLPTEVAHRNWNTVRSAASAPGRSARPRATSSPSTPSPTHQAASRCG